ncbi:MAG: phosphatase PAP2 family protein [Omnitrophica WOR_2 bacterium]
MNPIFSFGIQLIQALQILSPALDGVMQFFTFLGRVEFYLLLMPLIYWLVDAQLGMRVFLLLIGSNYITNGFKQLMRQPRPYWIGDVRGIGLETSYGLPSSHASDSLSIWGYLAYRVRTAWFWVLACTVILLISLSRLYLGVHFPTDILGGWLTGLIAIFLLTTGERLLLPWLKKQSQASLIAISFSVSLAMILVGRLVIALVASTPDPASWAQFSTEARTLTSSFSLAGALFGGVAGYILMLNHARFQVKRAVWQQAACYLLGIAGILLIYFGLDMLFASIAADESVAGYTLRYIRYGTVCLWAMFGAPWAFLRVGLAEPVMKKTGPALAVQQGLA